MAIDNVIINIVLLLLTFSYEYFVYLYGFFKQSSVIQIIYYLSIL